MKAFQAVFALIASVCATGPAVAPTPGAFSIYLNSTAMDNLFQTMVPLLGYFLIDNSTLPIDVTKSSLLYSFTFKDIHIVHATGYTIKKFEYLPGTDKIHVAIGGVDLQTTINAELEALHFIPFKASAVNITNCTLDFVVESTPATDGVHWQLSGTPQVFVQDVKIEMSNGFLNWMVGLMRGTIDKIISNDLMPMLQTFIETEVASLNKMVSSESAYTFDIGTSMLLNGPQMLNLTMTKAPATVANSDLIELYFNGLFDFPQNATHPFGLPDYLEDISDYPPRLQHSLSQQLWFNEEMLNSFINIAGQDYFKFEIGCPAFQQQILNDFATIKSHYGPEATVQALAHYKKNPHKAFRFSMEHGMTFGEAQTEDELVIDIMCSNGTNATSEKCLSFSSSIIFQFNLTMHDIVIWPHMDSLQFIDDVNLQYSKYPDMTAANYTDTLSKGFAAEMDAFNLRFVQGWSLMNIDPAMAMIGGLIKNITISPYITDGWMFAGFEMQADLPNESPVLEFIE